MIKAKEFAEGYVWFYFNATSNKWQASLTPMAPTSDMQNNYYRIRIPVPEELLANDLPNQDQIEVSE